MSMSSQWSDPSWMLVSFSAVRFGRIPKREKQRLLDEMQSYMNSLNESAAIEMDSTSARDAPLSSEDGNAKEAIGAISRAYHDIFTSSGSSQERAAKRAKTTTTTNNNTAPFPQDANFQQVSSHPTNARSYQSCPAAPAALCPVVHNDNQHTFHNVDNNRHNYLASANHNLNTTPQRGSSANHNSFHNAPSPQNQTSCPWKLAPGSKVLVRTKKPQKHIYVNTVVIYCLTNWSLYFLCPSLRHVLSMHVQCREQSAPVRTYGNPSLSVSLLQWRRW